MTDLATEESNNNPPPELPPPPPQKFGESLKLFVTLLLSFLTFLFIFLPLYLYRYIIYRVALQFRPDLKLLTAQSNIMACDSLTNTPQCSYVVQLVLDNQGREKEEPPSLAEIKEKLLLVAENYPTLTSKLETFMGLRFWKNAEQCGEEDDSEAKARVVNKVIYYFDRENEMENMESIHSSLVILPFDLSLPLWDCRVYANVKNGDAGEVFATKTVIFFRVHSALADGSSFLAMFQDEMKLIVEHEALLKIGSKALGNNYIKNNSVGEKIKFFWWLVKNGSYGIAKDLLNSKTVGHKDAGHSRFCSTKEIQLKDAKRIATRNLAPTSLLGIALVAGVKKRLTAEENDDDDEDEDSCDKTCKIICPMQIPFQTSEGLANNMAYVPIPAPTWISDPCARIPQLMNIFTQELMTSATFMSSCLLFFLIGCLPSTSLIMHLSSKLFPTLLGDLMFQCFPGSNVKKQFFKRDLVDIRVQSGCPTELLGVSGCFNMITYRSETRMSVTYPKDMRLPEMLEDEYKVCSQEGQRASDSITALGSLLQSLAGGFKK